MRTLATAGVESEAHLPFAGLRQLLHPVIGLADELPFAPARGAADGLRDDDAAVPDPFLIALAALNLIEEVATQAPVLLMVEDAHWLDRSSADVIAFIGRRLGSEPVMLLAAIRARVHGAGFSDSPGGGATAVSRTYAAQLSLDALDVATPRERACR